MLSDNQVVRKKRKKCITNENHYTSSNTINYLQLYDEGNWEPLDGIINRLRRNVSIISPSIIKKFIKLYLLINCRPV